MSKKTKTSKLDLKDILKEIDMRNYDFFESLSEEHKKDFNPYILMKFVSNSKGDPDIQEWFLERTNEFVNKNHWALSKNHKSLMWKLYAATGAGMPAFHPYVASMKSEMNKLEDLIAETYPTMKIEDVKLMFSLMDAEDQKEFLEKIGLDEKHLK